jgi:hypothetical protein
MQTASILQNPRAKSRAAVLEELKAKKKLQVQASVQEPEHDGSELLKSISDAARRLDQKGSTNSKKKRKGLDVLDEALNERALRNSMHSAGDGEDGNEDHEEEVRREKKPKDALAAFLDRDDENDLVLDEELLNDDPQTKVSMLASERMLLETGKKLQQSALLHRAAKQREQQREAVMLEVIAPQAVEVYLKSEATKERTKIKLHLSHKWNSTEERICTSLGLSRDTVMFFFDELPLDPEKTVEELHILDGDEIVMRRSLEVDLGYGGWGE